MMMGKTHLIVSTGITLSILQMTDQNITAPIIVITAVSALLPDVDEPNGLLAQRTIPNFILNGLKALLIITGIAFILFGAGLTLLHNIVGAGLIVGSLIPNGSVRKILIVFIGLLLIMYVTMVTPWNYIIGALFVIIPFLPHRGLTHSIYGIAGWIGILYYAALSSNIDLIWIAGGLSYTLHLLCDVLTNRGIRPLPPLTWRLRIPTMSTGGFSGMLVEPIFIVLTGVFVWIAFF
jgi:inner membrane protein